MRKQITAAELMAELNADPEYLARQAREAQADALKAAEQRRAEAPLVQALREVGVAVESVWDLVNTAGPYPEAVPVLLEHLQRSYPAAVREGIARALAVPDSGAVWAKIVEMYRRERGGRVKEGLAVAISAAANEQFIDDVIALARDGANGPSRALLLAAIARWADRQKARELISELKKDPELEVEAKVILRRLRPASSG